jgi:hypothetical protein
MFRERVLEDYISATGTTLMTLYMDPERVADTDGSETVRLHTVISALTNCSLKIQTAVTPDGPWSDLITKTGAGDTFDELECDPAATYRLDRYIRWALVTTAASWKACFCLLGIFEAGPRAGYVTRGESAGKVGGGHTVEPRPAQLVTQGPTASEVSSDHPSNYALPSVGIYESRFHK